jgi:hypothetical protein
VSDVGEPYAAAPEYMPRRSGPAMLLPPREVYTVVRENGYAPLGLPQQRGLIYTIAVVDSYGEDGRLVIDARNGRIVRFLPSYRMGDRMGDEVAADIPISRPRGSVPTSQAPEPAPQASVPIPPGSMPAPVPRVQFAAPRRLANRSASVPLPKPIPPRAVAEPLPAAPLAATPAPAPLQQSAAVQPKPAEATPPGVTTGQAPVRPSVQIMPTQRMPAAQGLD